MCPALPIRAEGMTLGQLLSGGWFEVPSYQRPYSWTVENELQELWADLMAQVAHAGDGAHYHFFGTLLTVDPAVVPGQKALELLDGQQRLATFVLLLVAIDRELDEIESSDDASPAVRRQAKEMREQIRSLVYRDSVQELRRLKLRAEEDQLLSNILHGNPPGQSKLGDAFQYLHRAVREYSKGSSNLIQDLRGLLRVLVDQSIIIHARCVYGFDPFAVFSTLNARGLPLTAAQILRARMLGLVSNMSSSVQELTKKCWDRVEALGSDGDKFLAYYLAAREGRRIPAKEVVRVFDRSLLANLAKDPGPEDKFGALAAELDEMADLFRKIAKGEWPVSTAQAVSDWRRWRLRLLVRELGVKQALPLILAVSYRKPEALAEVVDVIERAAFVALVCLPNQTRWGDKLFEWAAGINCGRKEPSELPADVRLWFLQQLGNPARALAENIPSQLRYGGKKKTLLRYFLTTLNDFGFPRSTAGRPDEQVVWDLRKIQIEHVSPRALADGISEFDKDKLGNLTPLYGRTNAALSNQPFAAKKTGYRDSPLRMTSHLAEVSSWDSGAIQRREEAMISFAVQLYCRDMQV